jgi:pyruvate/2-oxoglutarate dehydrogenase complex dihydrolipoamide acyltransferase (E2) component
MDLFDADDDVDSYDESGVLTRARSETAPAKAAPKRATAKKTAARKAAAPSPRAQAAPAPARAPAAKPAPAVQEQQADAGVRNRVRALLEQVPGLVDGRAVEFGDVVKHLRDEKLLGRSASASRFLKKHAPYVELTPEKNPNKLHWVSTLP